MKENKKHKVIKIQIMKTDIDTNTKLIGKHVEYKIVKSKTKPDGGRKLCNTNKITLSKLSNKVNNLTDNLNKLADNLNKLANNLNIVINKLNKLSKIVIDGFANVNQRIDNLIKLNNLKY